LNYFNIPLGLYSSIVNHGGTSTFLEYVALETYKRENPNNPYAFRKDIKPYSFTKSHSQWKKDMGRLVELGLVVKQNGSYISRTKLTDWSKDVDNEFIKKLSGTLRVDLWELYTLRNNKYEYLRDYVYMGLLNSVVRGRNYSRSWIEKVTGFKKYMQRKIEKNNPDKVIVNHKLSPSNTNDEDSPKVFPAHINMKDKTISKVKVERSNCFAVQQGNKYSMKHNYIFSFKAKNSIKQKSSFYKTLNSDVEVKSGEEYDAVFNDDTSKSVRSQMFFSTQTYNKFANKKLCKALDFDNTAFVTQSGNVKSIGNVLKTV